MSFSFPYSQYVIPQAVACNEGHLFCRTCLRHWINAHGHPNYPVGRQLLQASDVRGIITFDRVVDSLEVYCSRRMDGCNWTGALETISGHQQQCLHEPVQCTHRGCSQTFPRCEMQKGTPANAKCVPKFAGTAELRCPSGSTTTTRSWHVGRPL